MLRYWAFAIFVIIIAARSAGGLRGTIQAKRPFLQFTRGAILAVQVVFSILSFSLVGLAQTHALISATPLLVAALSVPLLGEQVGWRRWLAIIVGFIGVLIILMPGEGGFNNSIIVTIIAATLYAFYAVLTRLGSRSDSAGTSFFYTGIAGAITLSCIGPFYWTPLAPTDWIWMAGLCATGMTGHYLLIRALEVTDAASIQPLTYYQLVIVSIMGVTLYGEVLKANMVIGCAIVVAAGLFTAWREIQRSRKAKQLNN